MIASEGKSVAHIAHTVTCIVMSAQASGQPAPIMCEIANSTQGINDRIRAPNETRRHVRIAFG